MTKSTHPGLMILETLSRRDLYWQDYFPRFERERFSFFAELVSIAADFNPFVTMGN